MLVRGISVYLGYKPEHNVPRRVVYWWRTVWKIYVQPVSPQVHHIATPRCQGRVPFDSASHPVGQVSYPPESASIAILVGLSSIPRIWFCSSLSLLILTYCRHSGSVPLYGGWLTCFVVKGKGINHGSVSSSISSSSAFFSAAERLSYSRSTCRKNGLRTVDQYICQQASEMPAPRKNDLAVSQL